MGVRNELVGGWRCLGREGYAKEQCGRGREMGSRELGVKYGVEGRGKDGE